MPVYQVEVEAVDSWVFTVAATSEGEAERAALDEFRRVGGSGPNYDVVDCEEVDDMDEADADLEA